MELLLHVDASSPTALYRQLYDDLRSGIINGRFAPGSRLPGSRALADSLGISRITVTECYERLTSEGYLEARKRSGTFVCKTLPELSLYTSSNQQQTVKSERSSLPGLSRYGTAVDVPLLGPERPGVIRFNSHGPDVSIFPVKLWAKLLARRLRENSRELLQYTQHFAGAPALREELAKYLRQSRAVECDSSQIVIVSGSQQAIYLVARAVLNEGDVVAMESPGYRLAGRIFETQGSTIVPVPVDRSGIRVSELKRINNKKLKLAYVTPSHQFPTGVSLSLPRRRDLLKWARDHSVLILEDDYDSEFRYSERPLPSLQGLSPDRSVIYVGTFSKLLFPTLRLGYLVLPPDLVNAFVASKILCDIQSSSIDQRTLTDFLSEGHLEPYVRRMRTVYGNRRALVIQEMHKHFGSKVTVSGDDAGMHFMAEFNVPLSQPEAYERALEGGVRLEPVYWPGNGGKSPNRKPAFVFPFASVSDSDVRLAVERLARALL